MRAFARYAKLATSSRSKFRASAERYRRDCDAKRRMPKPESLGQSAGPVLRAAFFEHGALGQAREHTTAGEIKVGLAGGLAPLGDCPNDQGRPPLGVAGDENTRLARTKIFVGRDGTPLVVAEV